MKSTTYAGVVCKWKLVGSGNKAMSLSIIEAAIGLASAAVPPVQTPIYLQ